MLLYFHTYLYVMLCNPEIILVKTKICTIAYRSGSQVTFTQLVAVVNVQVVNAKAIPRVTLVQAVSLTEEKIIVCVQLFYVRTMARARIDL